MKASMVVKLVAAPGKADELETFLTEAIAMAEEEEFMPV